MKFKLRKKTQRRFNKIVRDMNKSIEDDELWRGRFVIRQKYSTWGSWEDHSGGMLTVTIEMIDKKTGQRKENYVDMFTGNYPSSSISYNIFRMINDFIIEDCCWSTWDDPHLREDKTDYRKISI